MPIKSTDFASQSRWQHTGFYKGAQWDQSFNLEIFLWQHYRAQIEEGTCSILSPNTLRGALWFLAFHATLKWWAFLHCPLFFQECPCKRSKYTKGQHARLHFLKQHFKSACHIWSFHIPAELFAWMQGYGTYGYRKGVGVTLLCYFTWGTWASTESGMGGGGRSWNQSPLDTEGWLCNKSFPSWKLS